MRSLLTGDKIVGAYHFGLFNNPFRLKRIIYVTDFGDSAIKVFDLKGRFIETIQKRHLSWDRSSTWIPNLPPVAFVSFFS